LALVDASVEVSGEPGVPAAIILVAHGGQADSQAPAGRARLTYLWQRLVSHQLREAARAHRAQIWRLRYRVRGWNGTAQDPVKDLRWALKQASQQFPGVPVILVGHSMGGRAVIFAAGEPNVSAVCAFAPWIEAGDPYAQLAGKPVLIVHGSSDRVTDPRRSRQLAERVGVRFVLIDGDGHAMLGQPGRWRDLLREFVRQRLVALANG
jgi:alpha-beta hydrolase superfamily lysophospholipase